MARGLLPAEVRRPLLEEGTKSLVGVGGALTDRRGQCLRPESVVAGHVADAWQCGEDELVGQRCVAGFPIHLAAKLVGHNNIEVAQGYTAVYQKDVFDAYARFITNRADSPDPRA